MFVFVHVNDELCIQINDLAFGMNEKIMMCQSSSYDNSGKSASFWCRASGLFDFEWK